MKLYSFRCADFVSYCALLSVIIIGFCFPAGAQTLAFPEAEGWGRYASGGRGGNVYYVTRLDDCSDANLVEGTLRWALRTGDDTPRTILFKVCGTIYLTSKLKFEHPNVTIAGQTAPGGGICIAGANIYVCKNNVIIRHIRFRAGDVPNTSYPALDVENAKNVILDHCSFTWSMEECLTMYDTDSTTVQWCIIGEGLYNSKNKKGARSYATQWGGEHSTMHHTLITNCHNRTPRFNGTRDDAHIDRGNHDHDAFVDSEFQNNVIFNWGKKNSLYGGENDTTVNKDADGVHVGYCRVYMENNYFRAGPTTKVVGLSDRYFVQGSKDFDYGQWYLSGNKFEVDNQYNPAKPVWHADSLARVNADNLYGYMSASRARAFNLDGKAPSQEVYDHYVLVQKVSSSGLVAESADAAFESVCDKAGASLPRYDEEDIRLLDEAAGRREPEYAGQTQKTYIGIIDSQDDIQFSKNDYFLVGDSVVGGYPFLDAVAGDSIALDSDGDGLPDSYEIEIGLDPQVAADGAMLTASGYSNLETYLNGVATGSIDKTKYETIEYVSVQPKPVDDSLDNAIPLQCRKNDIEMTFKNGVVIINDGDKKYSLDGKKID